jgi:hypothetical protein
MAPIGYSGPWGKTICGKKQKLKISCQTSFNRLYRTIIRCLASNVVETDEKGKCMSA